MSPEVIPRPVAFFAPAVGPPSFTPPSRGAARQGLRLRLRDPPAAGRVRDPGAFDADRDAVIAVVPSSRRLTRGSARRRAIVDRAPVELRRRLATERAFKRDARVSRAAPRHTGSSWEGLLERPLGNMCRAGCNRRATQATPAQPALKNPLVWSDWLWRARIVARLPDR